MEIHIPFSSPIGICNDRADESWINFLNKTRYKLLLIIIKQSQLCDMFVASKKDLTIFNINLFRVGSWKQIYA